MEKIKIEELTVEAILKEALQIPDGWHEEVWVEKGIVSFSSPMTQNSWSSKSVRDGSDPDYIGDLRSVSIGDFEGFYKREDGKIEIDDPENESDVAQAGEYYEKAEIVDYDEGIDRIVDSIADPDETEWKKLVEQAQNRAEEQNTPVQGGGD